MTKLLKIGLTLTISATLMACGKTLKTQYFSTGANLNESLLFSIKGAEQMTGNSPTIDDAREAVRSVNRIEGGDGSVVGTSSCSATDSAVLSIVVALLDKDISVIKAALANTLPDSEMVQELKAWIIRAESVRAALLQDGGDGTNLRNKLLESFHGFCSSETQSDESGGSDSNGGSSDSSDGSSGSSGGSSGGSSEGSSNGTQTTIDKDLAPIIAELNSIALGQLPAGFTCPSDTQTPASAIISLIKSLVSQIIALINKYNTQAAEDFARPYLQKAQQLLSAISGDSLEGMQLLQKLTQQYTRLCPLK